MSQYILWSVRLLTLVMVVCSDLSYSHSTPLQSCVANYLALFA